MGSCVSQEPDVDFDGPVDFNHFNILRAIGKGAFGKVCIVKKKDTKQMYAMKYMNKIQIIRKHAVDNVLREIKILRSLDHAFLVNLWFSFQDREDMFMVLDLMLGGDLSYHLEKSGRFNVPRVRLYMAEMGLALEYLRSKGIIHRDIKPANMLLDSQGHVHVTDFNVATIVRPNGTVLSTTGTKPYMAPEVVQPPSTGYTYAVDWWSLGISAYEMMRGHRPFTFEKHMGSSDIYELLLKTRPSASVNWDANTCDILKVLLHPETHRRLQDLQHMRNHPFFEGMKWDDVEKKNVTPAFIPPHNRINCDPTHELEEMIVEPNPLHKKRHRLSKRSTRTEDSSIERELIKIENKFRDYNRFKEKLERESADSSKRLLDSSPSQKSRASRENAEAGPEEGKFSVEVDVEPERNNSVVEKTSTESDRVGEGRTGGDVLEVVEAVAEVSGEAKKEEGEKERVGLDVAVETVNPVEDDQQVSEKKEERVGLDVAMEDEGRVPEKNEERVAVEASPLVNTTEDDQQVSEKEERVPEKEEGVTSPSVEEEHVLELDQEDSQLLQNSSSP